MSKLMVIATLSGGSWDEEEVWSNQWGVGTFDDLESCYQASDDDLRKTLNDAFEYRFEDEGEAGVEKLEKLVTEILTDKWKTHREVKDLKIGEPEIIVSIQYEQNEYADVEINYLVIKLN